jgi:hypothetical protein
LEKIYTAREVADALGHKHTVYVLMKAREGLVIDVGDGTTRKVRVGQKIGDVYGFTAQDIRLFQMRRKQGRPRKAGVKAEAQAA